MRKIITLIIELLLISLAIFVADAWQQNANIIPRSLIHLPQVDYSQADFWLIFKVFLGLHFTAFFIMQLRAGVWIYSDTQRTVRELFVLIAIYSLSALAIFLATTVNFDPDLMAGIGLCSVGLFLLLHICAALVKGVMPHYLLIDLLRQLFKRLFSISGVLVLLLALTPPILAYAFVSNRDIANVITQIRITLSDTFSSTNRYSLVSISGDYHYKQPMLARTPLNDSANLYVLERAGRILSTAYPYDPSSPPKVVLDLQDKLGYVEVENGALGFAFHPEFANQKSKNAGFIYLYYTAVHDNKQINHISRFDLTSGSPREVSNSEIPLLILKRESSGYHNGGSVEFGPDGFLYIALGEGIVLDEISLAKTLRQGIIRIDVDMLGNGISHPIKQMPANGIAQNYYIPSDNPFVGRSDIREEYWAIGLRNPFRISFDSLTGRLWAGDVGSTKWEEVNLIEKGGNYQFPFIEGYETTTYKRPDTIIGQESSPVYTYLHTAYDRAVIGGVVYRGNQFPELSGKYIFADNYSSKLFAMRSDGARISEVQEIARAAQFAQRGVSSVTQIANGDLLVTTLGRASEATGEVLVLSNKAEFNKLPTVKPTTPIVLTKDDARELFVSNCARCHGAEGQADGPDSSLFGVKIPDFSKSTFQSSRSDEHLRLVITKGGESVGRSPLMPPWDSVFSAEEIDALVIFIRTLQIE